MFSSFIRNLLRERNRQQRRTPQTDRSSCGEMFIDENGTFETQEPIR